ncbi:Elongation of very long chain fatty acids protein [Aphelenchoides besseyi]|nr:Elongation of very long chain fatty acids protein [Aphelenchoides besseyi]
MAQYDYWPRYGLENYTYVFPFEDTFDPIESTEWMQRNWVHSISFSVLYVLSIYAGQRFMESRKPCLLDGSLFWWNVFLSVFSLAGFLRMTPEMWWAVNSNSFTYSICTASYAQGVTGYWTEKFAMSKVFEFVDTAFIVLRKRPLIFLHWYHHVTVHTVMYAYYALRAAKVHVPKFGAMFITILQILQMVMGVYIAFTINSLKSAGKPCQQTWENLFFSFAIYGSYFLLFVHFFYQTYLSRGNRYTGVKQQNTRKIETEAQIKELNSPSQSDDSTITKNGGLTSRRKVSLLVVSLLFFFSNNLRNDDFRKLLAAGTPRAAPSGDSTAIKGAGPSFTHKQHRNVESQVKKKKPYRPPQQRDKKDKTEADELVDESEANLQNIMRRYRDRAAERRKGTLDGQDVEFRAKLANGLHAFRNDDPKISATDRREQEIRESKFLGGDIEHTHLVRGLDYQLLNKTRDDIQNKKSVKEEEKDVDLSAQNPITKNAYLNKISESKMARNICRTLFETEPPTRNELFQRGRMAYVVDLEDQEQEIPITLLRSIFECANDIVQKNINVNNMVIEKLTEVLSYLRTDNKRKRKGRETVEEKNRKQSNTKTGKSEEKIFDDVGDYVPDRNSKSTTDRERNDRRDRNYFDDDRKPRSDRDDRHSDRRRDSKRSVDESKSRKDDRERETKTERSPFKSQTSEVTKPLAEAPPVKKSRIDEEDAYAELFPSSDMFYGGGDDSDEEDFSKMDAGPRKGPIKRWDFDTSEEYERYQSGREAMPKA